MRNAMRKICCALVLCMLLLAAFDTTIGAGGY